MSIRQQVEELIGNALDQLVQGDRLVLPEGFIVTVEQTRDPAHGEFASNVALVLAKPAGLKPRDLAADLAGMIPASDLIDRIEVAGPGFINFHLARAAYLQVIPEILDTGTGYGRGDRGAGQRALVEFVSVNPTGPLHVGHGRGAAFGAAVANLLDTAGYTVEREYYVNDAGRQMDILAISVWLRYLERCGRRYPFPAKAYQGAYVAQIAADLHQDHGARFDRPLDQLFNDEWENIDPDDQLDSIIRHARNRLGDEDYELVFNRGLDEILTEIRGELEELGIRFNTWFSEKSLQNSGRITECLKSLEGSGDIYPEAGAKWFRSSAYGDEKDRVVVRENGQTTYFASDIAYHQDKYQRGYTRIINIWGADHHGYIARVKAALAALGGDPDRLEILLVQFAVLFRGSEKVQMSTRSGEYVTLRDLYREVGVDATRFFYVSRKADQHLEFDLELAKSQTNDNPVYYVQYAHARICSVLREMEERGYTYDRKNALEHLGLLEESHEQALLTTLSRYPDLVEAASDRCEPHQIGFYLRDLAMEFHSYYNSHQFLIEDAPLRAARISLITAVRQVIHNGLEILGVSAPRSM